MKSILFLALIISCLNTKICMASVPIEIYKIANCPKTNNSIIIPYFTNIFSVELLKRNKAEIVKNYILWYLDHINYPDKYGLTGTIYDYQIIENKLFPTYQYDSADSYVGTFLILIYFYLRSTDDMRLIHVKLNHIKDIAYVIVKLTDQKDGLVFALPNKDVKYLLDNIEAYIGLSLFCKILKKFKDPDSKYYCVHAKKLGNATKKSFKKRQGLCWAIDSGGCHLVADKDEYPHNLAKAFWQIYNGKKIKVKKRNFTCEQLYAIKAIKKAFNIQKKL
ncbi:MAG: hypothetical protein N3A59_08655 [Thermodesulfovibrionales bacterium]|nr:hypothetical protein [Thermodesulfovibrionales bacterium]